MILSGLFPNGPFIRRALLILAVLALPPLSRAQKMYSLEEAVRTAVENNADLEVARLEMRKAGQQVRQAWGNAMPSLDFTARYTRAIKKPVFFLPDFGDSASNEVTPIEIGSNHSVDMGFTATQVLFNSVVFIGVGTAAIYEKASRENYRAQYNKTFAAAERAYYSVLLAEQVLTMTKASLTNAEDNLRNVKILNTQGIVSDYDLIRAEVQVENVRPMVLEAERNVAVSLNGFKMALGLPAMEKIGITGNLEFTPADSSLVENPDLVEQNASLRALDYQKEIADKLITVNRSEYLPTISAFGNYQWQAQKNTLNIGPSDLIKTSQVGVSLNLNLFNGFQTTARVGQARSDLHKVQEQASQLREVLKTQVQSILLRLQEAERRIRSQQRTVELAEKSFKIATTRYKTGSGTQLEVNDADVSLLRARLNRVQAIYDYLVAKSELEEILCQHQL